MSAASASAPEQPAVGTCERCGAHNSYKNQSVVVHHITHTHQTMTLCLKCVSSPLPGHLVYSVPAWERTKRILGDDTKGGAEALNAASAMAKYNPYSIDAGFLLAVRDALCGLSVVEQQTAVELMQFAQCVGDWQRTGIIDSVRGVVKADHLGMRPFGCSEHPRCKKLFEMAIRAPAEEARQAQERKKKEEAAAKSATAAASATHSLACDACSNTANVLEPAVLVELEQLKTPAAAVVQRCALCAACMKSDIHGHKVFTKSAWAQFAAASAMLEAAPEARAK